MNLRAFFLFVSAAAVVSASMVAANIHNHTDPVTAAFVLNAQTCKTGQDRLERVTPGRVIILRHDESGNLLMVSSDRPGRYHDSPNPRLGLPRGWWQEDPREVWTGVDGTGFRGRDLAASSAAAD